MAAFWNDLYASQARRRAERPRARRTSGSRPQIRPAPLDRTHGIREFVVGTGGDNHGKFGSIRSDSQVRNNTTFGVLELTLGSTSYSWSFVPAGSGTFTDSGNEACH